MVNEVSNRLKVHAREIMDLWEKRALQEVVAARHQTSLALRNSLPEYLDQLIDALSTTIERTTLRIQADKDDSTRVSKTHGHERAGILGYSMDQVILEYHILRQSIFEALEKDGPISSIERDVIIDSIEQAVNDSATQFSDTLNDIQELFMLTLTHDLRTPITSAKMSAQIVLRHLENIDLNRQAMNRIIDNMNRIDSMISDLLDSSRLRTGQAISLEFKEECDLDSILRDVVDELTLTHGDRFIIKSMSPIVGHFSPKGLRRVFENILINAVKYGAPNTPITATISSESSKIVISFHNEGHPISETEQASIFQRFRRSELSRDKRGWGIGLVLVKGIVEAHRGNVKVKSELNDGTTFIIELPNALISSSKSPNGAKGATASSSAFLH